MDAIDRVLADFAASDWLKTSLAWALKRDPVDAAADAEYLAVLLRERCDVALQRVSAYRQCERDPGRASVSDAPRLRSRGVLYGNVWSNMFPTMDETVTWHIGSESGGDERLDRAPPRAYFFWKRGGQVVRSAQFAREELEAEIARLKAAGEDVTEFERALRKLG